MKFLKSPERNKKFCRLVLSSFFFYCSKNVTIIKKRYRICLLYLQCIVGCETFSTTTCFYIILRMNTHLLLSASSVILCFFQDFPFWYHLVYTIYSSFRLNNKTFRLFVIYCYLASWGWCWCCWLLNLFWLSRFR